jgi:hypothetical protein
VTWTNAQKQLAVRAAKAAGMGDEHRQLLLNQMGGRAIHNGRITSTSPRLTQDDFDHYMAVVERMSGGQVQIGGPHGSGFPVGHFQRTEDRELDRVRWTARRIANTLELEGHLKPDGAGLAGWIMSRVTAGRTSKLDDLTREELHKLINGLQAWGRRLGVQWTGEPETAEHELQPTI